MCNNPNGDSLEEITTLEKCTKLKRSTKLEKLTRLGERVKIKHKILTDWTLSHFNVKFFAWWFFPSVSIPFKEGSFLPRWTSDRVDGHLSRMCAKKERNGSLGVLSGVLSNVFEASARALLKQTERTGQCNAAGAAKWQFWKHFERMQANTKDWLLFARRPWADREWAKMKSFSLLRNPVRGTTIPSFAPL